MLLPHSATSLEGVRRQGSAFFGAGAKATCHDLDCACLRRTVTLPTGTGAVRGERSYLANVDFGEREPAVTDGGSYSNIRSAGRLLPSGVLRFAQTMPPRRLITRPTARGRRSRPPKRVGIRVIQPDRKSANLPSVRP